MNKNKPHVYVIPEDDADRQLAVGFSLHYGVDSRRIQVVPPAGGWNDVLRIFDDEYVHLLRNYQHAHVVMLIDFDGQIVQRRNMFESSIPADVKPRVFVVGSKEDPETLKKDLKIDIERIGTALADDCEHGTTAYWAHEQLSHNDADRLRLIQTVKPFLFVPPGSVVF